MGEHHKFHHYLFVSGIPSVEPSNARLWPMANKVKIDFLSKLHFVTIVFTNPNCFNLSMAETIGRDCDGELLFISNDSEILHHVKTPNNLIPSRTKIHPSNKAESEKKLVCICAGCHEGCNSLETSTRIVLRIASKLEKRPLKS